MVGQPRRNFMKMASWSRVSEHLVNPIGMSDQLKWNNQFDEISNKDAIEMILIDNTLQSWEQLCIITIK